MSRPEYSKGGNIRVYSPAGLILCFASIITPNKYFSVLFLFWEMIYRN